MEGKALAEKEEALVEGKALVEKEEALVEVVEVLVGKRRHW